MRNKFIFRLSPAARSFDTSTARGLKQAERYKARLENLYDKVTVTLIGLDRVRIEGRVIR
jgi:hypothetical protein